MMENTKYQMEELYDKPCNMYNVGAMLPYMGYMPKTLDQIILGYIMWKNNGFFTFKNKDAIKGEKDV